jgi:putative transposase
MVAFIDQHRDVYGVEPICAHLPIAPSTYFLHKARQADPTARSARAQRDDELRVEIQRVWDANQQVYGARCGASYGASRSALRTVRCGD